MAAVRAELLDVDGVRSVSANTVTGSIVIIYDHQNIDPVVLWTALERLDYVEQKPMHNTPDSEPVVDKLASAAADQITKAALDFALERLVGRPAAMLIGALI